MDYYSTLGLKRGASDADIKKAYRSMAMKHHPDRGGDEKKFKEISQAYDFLSDPEKRRMIDAGMDPNQQGGGFGHRQQGSPFEFHFNSADMHDIFNNFGFGQRPAQRNKTINITVEVTLEEVLKGKELNAEISMPSGIKKMINIEIPSGIEHGQQIRYSGMGDASISNLRAGDLIVNVFVKQHPIFKRDGDSLIYEHEISVWDALTGVGIEIKTLDNKTLNIAVPSGTQPETVLSCKGEGIPNIRSKHRGNLLIKIIVRVPKNLSQEQILKIKNFKNEL